MRKLAYRAWHKTQQKMYRVIGWREDDDGQLVVWCKDEHGITLRFADTINGIPGLTVLMQSTGLQDRHGNEVYEGDRVYNPDYDEQGVVTWVNNGPGFLVLNPNKTGCFVLHCAWEIIGNIYETPELLESEVTK